MLNTRVAPRDVVLPETCLSLEPSWEHCVSSRSPTLSLPFDGHGLRSFGSQSDLGLSECLSRLRHVERAAEVAAWGEILTLPVVLVLIFSLLAQPRLTYGMAQDGKLQAGTLISGIATHDAGCHCSSFYLSERFDFSWGYRGVLFDRFQFGGRMRCTSPITPTGFAGRLFGSVQCLMFYHGARVDS